MSTPSDRTRAPAGRSCKRGGGKARAPISRVWRGWTTRERAAAYQELVTGTVLPGHERLEGYRGGCLMRRESEEGDEVEFMVITRWDSYEAIRKFAGDDCERATIPLTAEQLLERFDARAVHYRQLYGADVDESGNARAVHNQQLYGPGVDEPADARAVHNQRLYDPRIEEAAGGGGPSDGGEPQ
jgi:heme-degrading monooxygenase HmoA